MKRYRSLVAGVLLLSFALLFGCSSKTAPKASVDGLAAPRPSSGGVTREEVLAEMHRLIAEQISLDDDVSLTAPEDKVDMLFTNLANRR